MKKASLPSPSSPDPTKWCVANPSDSMGSPRLGEHRSPHEGHVSVVVAVALFTFVVAVASATAVVVALAAVVVVAVALAAQN